MGKREGERERWKERERRREGEKERRREREGEGGREREREGEGGRGREREREREGEGGREREREGGLANTGCTPTLCNNPFVLLLIRCPHGTVLLDMVGLDRRADGMDVDVAAGVENPRYALRTNGSARIAALETGGV